MSAKRIFRVAIMFLSMGFVFPQALMEVEDRKPALGQVKPDGK
jgi:hypothetical protein